MNLIYNNILKDISEKKPLLAVLIDPEKFEITSCGPFLDSLPKNVTHLFVGGSTFSKGQTSGTVIALRKYTRLPVILFPGGADQVSEEADALLFLSLLSGRNPDFLIAQQVRAVPQLRKSNLEIIPTAYILVDGGKQSAVERVSRTTPIPQEALEIIINTALAGQYSGKKLIYLEAGSGALNRVQDNVIREVKKALQVPLIVGGGIRSSAEMNAVFNAGADMVVIGTAFENKTFKNN